MARAMRRAGNCEILRSHPLLEFRQGPYSYRLERRSDQTLYRVSDGQREIAVPLMGRTALETFGSSLIA